MILTTYRRPLLASVIVGLLLGPMSLSTPGVSWAAPTRKPGTAITKKPTPSTKPTPVLAINRAEVKALILDFQNTISQWKSKYQAIYSTEALQQGLGQMLAKRGAQSENGRISQWSSELAKDWQGVEATFITPYEDALKSSLEIINQPTATITPEAVNDLKRAKITWEFQAERISGIMKALVVHVADLGKYYSDESRASQYSDNYELNRAQFQIKALKTMNEVERKVITDFANAPIFRPLGSSGSLLLTPALYAEAEAKGRDTQLKALGQDLQGLREPLFKDFQEKQRKLQAIEAQLAQGESAWLSMVSQDNEPPSPKQQALDAEIQQLEDQILANQAQGKADENLPLFKTLDGLKAKRDKGLSPKVSASKATSPRPTVSQEELLKLQEEKIHLSDELQTLSNQLKQVDYFLRLMPTQPKS